MSEAGPGEGGKGALNPASRWWLLLPAAGTGRRMRSEVPKQYLPLAGRTVLEVTLSRFLGLPGLVGVMLVTSGDLPEAVEAALARCPVPVQRVPGGATRAESVRNGLVGLRDLSGTRTAAMSGDGEGDWVLVHDAARPCVRPDDVESLLRMARAPEGGLLAAPVRDTIKRVAADGFVDETVDRASLMHALTPQLFPARVLLDAIEAALAAGYPVTDEASAVERAGWRPRAVAGAADNLKITHPEDLAIARAILVCQGVLDD